jgi:amino acid transporter
MFFLAMGVPGTVFTLFGYTVGAVGTIAAIALWTLAALVALLQNHLWARLAEKFHYRNGGLAMFAAEGWKRSAPIVAPIAAMGYWLAWVITPAVMTRIAASFILGRWFPHLDWSLGLGPLRLGPGNGLAICILCLFALLNLRGIEAISSLAWLSGISLLVPICLCLAAPFVVPGWSVAHRLSDPLAGVAFATQARTLLAWMFAVCASVYASEMTFSFAEEYRSPRDMRVAGLSVGLFSLAVFATVPIGLAGLIDSAAFAANPAAAFVDLFARIVPVSFGADLIVAILVANLVITTSAAIADSGRSLCASAREALVPRQFASLNRHGVPHVAICFGLVLDIFLLAIDAPPVGMIATGTIGYMTATVLALSTVIVAGPFAGQAHERAWLAVTMVLLLLNLTFLGVGISSLSLTGFGGWREAVFGIMALLSSIPFFHLRQRQERSLAGAAALARADGPVT